MMRLLERNSAGGLSLTKDFVGDNIPQYAILSHTWGAGAEEVTFQDMKNDTGQSKTGYGKIWFCGEQARRDGLQYFWVDTCCIDKSSSAELSEAINSMFKWYQHSAVCYAYLSDITRDATDDELKTQFRRSKWFSRGWTLQELIAPEKLIFFSSDWRDIGDRHRWILDITEVTRIHGPALSGKPWALEQFSVAQKMSWASDRKTTREEDIAYCLLGIFNANIPLLYGEGGKAFIRLQEEIMKNSDDQSIFAWDPERLRGRRFIAGALAPSPAGFYRCFDIVSAQNFAATELYTVTNSGLRITGPLVPLFSGANTRLVEEVKPDLRSHPSVLYLLRSESEKDGAYVLILDCYKEGYPELLLGIILVPTARHDQYARYSFRPILTSCDGLNFCEGKTIYINERVGVSPAISHREKGMNKSFHLTISAPEFKTEVVEAVPSKQWDIERLVLSPPDSQIQLCAYNGWSWRAALLLKMTYISLSIRVTIVFGYDGRKYRPWIGLTSGLETLARNEEEIIYKGWNTSCCAQEVVICARPSDYVCRVSIVSKVRSLSEGLIDYPIYILDSPSSDYDKEGQSYGVELRLTWRQCEH